MKFNRCSYIIDVFNVEPSKETDDYDLVFKGWLHADSAVHAMALEIPATQTTWPIAQFTLPSADLVAHFDQTAANKRFALHALVPDIDLPFASARLNIQFEGGDSLSLGVGDGLKLIDRAWQEQNRNLVTRFESLGDNCELGLLHREFGAERLGLFRFAGINIHPLIAAIQNRFDGFATPDDLNLRLQGGEWLAVSRRYDFEFHTHRFVDTVTEDQVRELESRHLQFLVRLFLEDVEDASKIFVWRNGQRGNTQPEEGMVELYQTLRAIGPVRVLWITLADDDHPHGTVIQRDEGLFRGYIDTLAAYETATTYSTSSWITLLTEAVRVIDAATVSAQPILPVAEPIPPPDEPIAAEWEPVPTPAVQPAEAIWEAVPSPEEPVQTTEEPVPDAPIHPIWQKPIPAAEYKNRAAWPPTIEATAEAPDRGGFWNWLKRLIGRR